MQKITINFLKLQVTNYLLTLSK